MVPTLDGVVPPPDVVDPDVSGTPPFEVEELVELVDFMPSTSVAVAEDEVGEEAVVEVVIVAGGTVVVVATVTVVVDVVLDWDPS